MVDELNAKSLGQAIDEIAQALQGLSEANRAIAIRAACDYMGVALPQPAAIAGEDAHSSSQEVGTSAPAPALQTHIDIRSLKLQKQPATSLEMACVVAYYLQSIAPPATRKATVTASDLDTFFRQGDFPLPMRLAQVLPDAKSAGYFDSAERGSYKLNPVGHNLVVHGLPRSSAVPGTKTKRPRTTAVRKKAPSLKTRVQKRRRT